MFLRRRHGIFRMGLLKYVILHSLNEKPMHGYDLIKNLDEESSGFYRPSSGAIYPLLQTLEDQGYILGEEQEGKRVYSIASNGKEFLKESEQKVKSIIERRKAFFKERRELNHEIRNLTSLIMTNYRDLTPEKAEKIAQVLKEARRKISDITFE